ncbi:mandelate racemase/muconate lactonizing enzyme family protein [Halococcus sp. IIIV-5B]|uniref:mandelate racemase/muconate lactonizing enzyme family protein n=1 Tax=Halococcus sp. IIIV-5B TaxID=2321230 RepID=UPI000E7607C8|nr:enolase C-terminal domain-like protein [Halococcus sp. IIIV-5B]RJS97439.1 mandelate racemase [Halococcus sp. IIIV-5B]
MTADFRITGYETRVLEVPERTIGDSQTHVFETDELDYLFLELETDADVTGLGIDLVELRAPGRPSTETLRSRVDDVVGDVVGENPLALLNRRTRHRGGAHNFYSSGSYGPGVGVLLNMALWDAAAKFFDQPLAEFMGATDDSAPIYASGLSFGNDDATTREVYEGFAEVGEFDAAKVKVGYETVDEDIDRIELVDDVFGGLDTLMIDPNEAWTPKETLRKVQAIQDVGFDLYWIEDPVFRHDFDGMRRVREGLSDVHLTVGEYVGFEGKHGLLDAGAVDILNLQGLSAASDASTLAEPTGTDVAMSTDHGTDAMAVHAGLALPDVTYVECCSHALLDLSEEPYVVEDGRVSITDTPGHGVAFDEETLESHSR